MKDCEYQEIVPIEGKRLVIKTNIHPNTDGGSWGWIEGCTKNICWSDNSSFKRRDAFEFVKEYNKRFDIKLELQTRKQRRYQYEETSY